MQNIISFLQFNQYNADIIGLSIGIYVIFIWLAVVMWVVRDITMRSRNIFIIVAVTIFVLVGNIIALVIYLLIRPESTIEETSNKQMFYASILDKEINSCHNCQVLVRNDFKYCPNCSVFLQQTCPHCSTRVNPNWNYCITCNQSLKTNLKNINLLIKLANGIKSYYRVIRSNSTWFLQQLKNNYLYITSAISEKFSQIIGSIKPYQEIKVIASSIETLDKSEKTEKVERVEKSMKITQKNPTEKITAEKKVVGAKDTKSAKKSQKKKEKKEKSRGRPKGSSDSKPRKKRADAGKKRGSYK